MLKTSLLETPFSHHAHLFNSLILDNFSCLSSTKVNISKSLSIFDPFIGPAKECDENCIQLNDFLQYLDHRLSQELKLENQILQIQNEVWNEMNKICSEISDEKINKLAQNYTKDIIEAFSRYARKDERLVVKKFYNYLFNNNKVEALQMIEKVIDAALWHPVIMPIPLALVEQTKSLFANLKNNISLETIKYEADNIHKYLQNHFDLTKINTNDMASCEDLQKCFEKIIAEGKTCSVYCERFCKFQETVKEYQAKCVEKIYVKVDTKEILEKKFIISYDMLEISNQVKKDVVKLIFDQIPKNLKMLNASFELFWLKEYEDFGVYLSKLKLLNHLDLNFYENEVGCKK